MSPLLSRKHIYVGATNSGFQIMICNDEYNAKWNPINNAKRSESEEAKYKWARQWIMWYHSLPQDARNRIIKRMQRKDRRRDDFEDEYASIQRELSSLGLR